MELEDIHQNAGINSCWIRVLGQDSNGLFHAVAGTNWVVERINKTLQNKQQKPLDSPEQIPLRLLLELDLPVAGGQTEAEAAYKALQLLRKKIEKRSV